MAKKDMPDWMMDYVANIDNDECFNDFRRLSRQYYDERGEPEPKTSPALNLELHPYRKGTNRKITEKNPEDRGGEFIDEKYKRKSLELAEKYGYKRPDDKEVFDQEKLNQARENNMTGQKSRTYEDFVAEKAHAEYRVKNRDKAARFDGNKKKYRSRELRKRDPDKFYRQAQQDFNKKQEKFEDMRTNAVREQASNPQKSPQPEKTPHPEPDKKETPQKPQDKDTQDKGADDLKTDNDPKPSSRYQQTVNVTFTNNEKEDKQPQQEKTEPEPPKEEPKTDNQESKEHDMPEDGTGAGNSVASSRYFDTVGYDPDKSDESIEPTKQEMPEPDKDNDPDLGKDDD